MPRRISLSARSNQDAAYPDDLEIVLMQFEHPDLEQPLRLSANNTTRLSTDPLVYGTRSRWRGADPQTEPFLFRPISVELPADMEDVPHTARLVIEHFDASLPALLRSIRVRATLHMAIVLAGSPSTVEQEYLDLEIVGAQIGTVTTIDASRRAIEEEGVPMDIIGPSRFPGLFR